jgi:hypothetical protein
MKIKLLVLFIAILIGLLGVMVVAAQPAHSCGTIFNLSVTYDRDAAGYHPVMSSGSQAQFDCIAGRDPNFSNQRFESAVKAANYWFGLLGQEMGVNMLVLPAPSSP